MNLTNTVIKGAAICSKHLLGRTCGAGLPAYSWHHTSPGCAQVPLDLAQPQPVDYEACAQPKTALAAQLDLVQVQQHENILCSGALTEVSLMNTLERILHRLAIYYRAMEVKETCSLHLFN